MRVWKELPTELLFIIFDMIVKDSDLNVYLTNFTLTQCQLTCQHWREHAQRHIYRSIQLRSPNQFSDLLATLSSCQSNAGIFIKDVNIDPWDRFAPHVGFLQIFLLKCPNIETLDTFTDATGELFDQIRKAYERGACRRLRETPSLEEGLPESDRQKYLDAAYCLHNSLQTLSLDDDSVVTSTKSLPRIPLLQNLNVFVNLHCLNLKMKSLETIFQLGQYIEGCHLLKELHVEWYFNSKSSRQTDLAVSSTTPCPTIKELDFEDVPLTKHMLEYMIHAFPNLSSFSMGATSLPQITHTIPAGLWVKFLVYFNTREFKSLEIQQLYITDIPRVLADYFTQETVNKHLEIKYQESNALKLSYVNINYFNPRECIWQIKMNFTITVVFPVRTDRDELPHSKLLRKAGNFLQSLEFNGCGPVCGMYLKRNGFFLDSIFRLCPSITNLILSRLAFKNCSSDLHQNTSIQNLKIIECYLSQCIFLELSSRLPSLSNLWVEGPLHVDSNGRLQENCSKYIIEMPYTSFDILNWIMDFNVPRTYFNANIKVITSTKTYYYIGNEDGTVDEITDTSFQKSWENKSVFSMFIECNTMKALYLRLEHRSWHISITNP
jgi:hypothetical protein